MQFIIKIFAEIAVKSRSVRKQFIMQLRKNIRRQLQTIAPNHELIGVWDNIHLQLNCNDKNVVQQAITALQNTPGISQLLQVSASKFNDLDEISAQVIEYFGAKISGKTFAVRCKRSGEHSFTSSQAAGEIGFALLQANPSAKVDLTNPEILIKLEIKKDTVFVVTQTWQGLGGYPLGTIGQSLVLMSGGFDSTVAAYQILRRGVQTHFVFFNLGGSAHELGVKQVAHFLWQKYSSTHRSLFISVPFEQVLADILTNVDKPYMGVVLKRAMLETASKIAAHLSMQTLVTGESISQVSSQTVPNLALIDGVTSTLVMRPLLTWHKQEIIDEAEKIGTADFARQMPEYCGVISVNPTTCGKLEKCLREERKIDTFIRSQAAEKAVIERVDKVLLPTNDLPNFKIVRQIGEGQMVLDIRHPNEVLERPLHLPKHQVQTVPFYALNSQFKALDQSLEYFLYCEQGVMSKLHASHLMGLNFSNVGIYLV